MNMVEILVAVGNLLIAVGVAVLLMRIGGYFERI
jgi:hypothetical protein